MTKAEAKAILSIYRSSHPSDTTPEIEEALRLAESDDELRAFLNRESAFNNAFATQLKSSPVPHDLKERIMRDLAAETQVDSKISRFFPPAFFATAAAIVILLALTFTFWRNPHHIVDEKNAPMQLALNVHRESKPTLHGHPYSDFIHFISERGAKVPVNLPRGVSWENAIACDVVDSPAGKISLVCFRKDNTTFHLYTFPESLFPEITKENGPTFASLNGSCCAAWRTEDSVIFVFAKSSPQNIQKALEI